MLLGRAGAPTFYDKLLQVPLLNLSVILIDRATRSTLLRRFDPAALGRSVAPRRRHLAYMGVWAAVFAAMSAAGGVGDRHPGQWLPFWQQACADERPMRAATCREAVGPVQQRFRLGVQRGGVLRAALSEAGGAEGEETRVGRVEATAAFARGCELGFQPACGNRRARRDGAAAFERAPPTLDDYPIILRGSKGAITDHDPAALYARACRQGWPEACESVRPASRP